MIKRHHPFLARREQLALLLLAVLAVLGLSLNLASGEARAAEESPVLKLVPADSAALAKTLLIDIRTASKEDLMLLDGIGEKKAQDILDHRAAHPFTSVTQLLDVRGIGPKTFARLLPSLVSFGDSALVNRITAQNLVDLSMAGSSAATANLTPGKPKRAHAAKAIPKGELTNIVNLNSAGLEELCTLPGIGEVKAAAIIAWRKQNGAFQSVDDLLKVSGIGPKTLAKIRHRLSV